MSKAGKIPGTTEAWESGELGNAPEHAHKVSQDVKDQIDQALGLQAISIRLPKATIQAYKDLAELHGVGYQPLMRDAIVRWAESELKQLLAGAVESQRNRAKVAARQGGAKRQSETPPPDLRKAA